MSSRAVLVTGATGYIGGRLVPALLEAGHEVRCLARTPAKLDGLPWRSDVEVVEGDVSDEASLISAMEGIEATFYLVHSMGHSDDFAEEDRRAAETFRRAAEAAGVEQIVYLGGLGDSEDELSSHLQSRHEVGRTLADGPVPVTELRAAVIIGSGSASFEMLRNLVEILPAMITPRWVRTRCQPIAVRDILHYLVKAIEVPEAAGRVLEVGGPDIVTYEEMMRIQAEVAGLARRLIVPVPVLTPSLSSHWVGLVTPLPTDLARPLVASLQNEVVVNDASIDEIIPHSPISFRRALELALHRVDGFEVRPVPENEQQNAPDPAEPMSTDPGWSGGTLFTDERSATTSADPHDLHTAVTELGGDVGWYGADWLFSARGRVDSLVGGSGMRRGRRHPVELRVGDHVGFWRVEAIEADKLLRLRAELRHPGESWLEWTIEDDQGRRTLTQRAVFLPHGLMGRIYWFLLLPLRKLAYGRLARSIIERTGARS